MELKILSETKIHEIRKASATKMKDVLIHFNQHFCLDVELCLFSSSKKKKKNPKLNTFLLVP